MTKPDPWDVDIGRVPAALDQWTAPGHVEIIAGQLCWSYGGDLPARTVRAPADLLQRFIGLWDAPDAVIRNFAENFGVLYICEHNRPASHLKTDGPATAETAFYSRCKPRMIRGHIYAEPVSVWRDWSAKMAAALRIAVNLHGHAQPNREDWLTLRPSLRDALTSEEAYRSNPFSSSIKSQRHSLSLFVSGCLREAQVELSFGWMDKPIVSLGSGTLFGALSLRLVLAVSRTEGLALCSSCRMPFIPARHPRSDERQYCTSCRKRASQRDASADYRMRKKLGMPSTRRRRA